MGLEGYAESGALGQQATAENLIKMLIVPGSQQCCE